MVDLTDPCKTEVEPGSREESASPAWLAAPAMNACDTTKVYIWRLDTGCHNIKKNITKETEENMVFLTLIENYSFVSINDYSNDEFNNRNIEAKMYIKT